MSRQIDAIPQYTWEAMNGEPKSNIDLITRDLFAMITRDAKESVVEGDKMSETVAPLLRGLEEKIRDSFGQDYVPKLVAAMSAEASAKNVMSAALEIMAEKKKQEENDKQGEQSGESDQKKKRRHARSEMLQKKIASEFLQKADKDMDDAKEEGEMLLKTVGSEKGDDLGDEQIDELMRLKNMYGAREFLKLVGRADALIQDNDMPELVDGNIEPTGIKPVSEFEDLLTDELAGLTHATLRLPTLARVSEGEALGYKRVDYKPRGNGPAVIMVDRSGSMSFTDIIVASAVAYSTAKELGSQGKSWHVIAFDTVFQDLRKGSKPSDLVKLMGQLLRLSPGGGTDVSMAVMHGHDMAKKLGEDAGVLLITDSTDDVGYSYARKWVVPENLNMVTISINSDRRMEGLAKLSKAYATITHNDIDKAAEAASHLTHKQG